ncbi:CAF17-like 4Fe-4S cluster assembly/insertion protein YgfZ [Panacagrimonas perspica]|uniref:CAF17-like 4Fe-4S cluster assembly/insertion protein YgfZ n=1 Tax=Panacagrimonas perspica TaxID=381431 RepID=UPI0013C30E0C|nr:folate-binding protein YgfZ [Panacagrimonas perspica]
MSGADAEIFLQGQLSADVAAVKPECAGWASYNSPKGRMLAVIRVVRSADAIDLRMPRSLVEPVARRLRMFVLRSKVSLVLPDPAETDEHADARDRAELIEAGVPVVYPETQDRWVAQMANLDLIGGISFTKGCYTGQEVVARLHYLGNLKKRLFRVSGKGAVPAPGTAIRDSAGDGQAVGDIVDAVADAAGFTASAVLQVAAAESSSLVLDRSGDAALSRPQAYRYPDPVTP